jgi:hypothetical protein
VRTACYINQQIGNPISIHSLREEGDVRKVKLSAVATKHMISIHSLREEGDKSRDNICFQTMYRISIHSLREEGDNT